MDLWVVAVAAGAGYIAKNLQNLSLDKKESLGEHSSKSSCNFQSESKNLLQQFRDKTCPLRRLAENTGQDDAFLEVDNHSDVKFSEFGGLNTRDREPGVASASDDDYNMGWISSLPSVFSVEGSLEFGEGKSRNFSRVNQGGELIRSKGRLVHSIRPSNSLGSCLDARECRQHENTEDNASLYPSMSPVRPVLATDGTGMISRSVYVEEELQKKPKTSSSNLQSSESCDVVSGRSFSSQGPPNTMLLFITGMTVGILSATTTWKNEVDKLNKLLKHKQNLVQDLQDELEMKDMLMVKELSDEGHPAPGDNHKSLSIHEPVASPSDMNMNKVATFDGLKAQDKSTENSELLTTIEAELQAELEMLEHNMNASARESVVELDPGFEPEIVQGDLKPKVINDPSESGNQTTETTGCSQPANYSVSPWELSLRLHELIESRLETRIKELEMALGNSQNTVQVLGSHSIASGRRFSDSETESSSAHQSPTCICDEHDKREDRPSAENVSSNHADAHKDPKGIVLSVSEQDRPVDLVPDMPHLDKQTSTTFVSNEDSDSEDESTDESDMLLIKQILERRRSSSNFNLEFG